MTAEPTSTHIAESSGPVSPTVTTIPAQVARVPGLPNAEDTIDTSPFFDYLQSPEGHEIAKGLLGIIQDLKKAAVNHTATNARLEKILQVGIVLVVVIAATLLATLGKIDGPVGILFGTLVGYVFGRRS